MLILQLKKKQVSHLPKNLKIKIFIVHFKREPHRLLFGTVTWELLRCTKTELVLHVNVPSALKRVKAVTGQREDCSRDSPGPHLPSKAAWKAAVPNDSRAAPTGDEPRTDSPSLTGAAHRWGTPSSPAEQKTRKLWATARLQFCSLLSRFTFPLNRLQEAQIYSIHFFFRMLYLSKWKWH